MIDTRSLDGQRLALLRKWAANDPNDLDAVGPLASILEQQGHAAEAKKLLLPVKDKLGDGEGAGALGMILGHEGNYEGAYALLWPYVKIRLDKLHAAQQASETALRQLWDRELSCSAKKRARPNSRHALQQRRQRSARWPVAGVRQRPDQGRPAVR